MGEKRKGMNLKMRTRYRRITAYLLTFVMLITNIGSNVSIAMADNSASPVSAVFGLSGDDIREATFEAIENGDLFDYASLDLAAEDSSVESRYAKLLGRGNVYEIYPDMEDGTAPAGADLRLFIHAKADIEEGIQLTGDEEIIFLFINESGKKIQFSAAVDGFMTTKVTVNAHKTAVQVPEQITTPSNATEKPEETDASQMETAVSEGTYAPEETLAPAETTAPVETTAPEETLPQEGSEAAEETATVPETETSVETLPQESSQEVLEVAPTEMPEEASTETLTEAATEEVTEAATEASTEASPETEAEPEAEDEEEASVSAEDEGLTVGISRKEVALVADAISEGAENAGKVADEDDYEILEDKNYYEGIELIDDVTPAEDKAYEGGNSDGRIYGEVEIDRSASARAYVTTFNELHIDISKDVIIEPERKEYTLILNHVLSTKIGRFADTEIEIPISSDDFSGGTYNVLHHAYNREGIEVSDRSVMVSEADFEESGYFYVEINYHIMDGWRAVYNKNYATRSIYIGTFDDVEVLPIDQKAITFYYYYENGGVARPSETIMVEETDGKYSFTYKVDVPSGYTMMLEDDSFAVAGNKISGELTEERTDLTVVFAADEASYTIRHIYPALEGSGNKDEIVEYPATGKAGELSEAVAEPKAGFQPRPVIQKEIADGLVVEISYIRETYQLNYDTQGGSYIKSKTGLFESEIEVFSVGSRTEQVPTGEMQRGDINCPYGGISLGHWSHKDKCYEWIPVFKTVTVTAYNPTPVKAGYTFDGWYYDKDCTEAASPKIQLTGDATVYAKWKAETVNYTVVYMQEKLNSDNTSYYAFTESAVKEALAGSVVKGEDDKQSQYKYHKFDSSTSSSARADGSTVVFVYYALKTYKITFDLNDRNATLVMDGKTYRNREYTLDLKLGLNVASVWPTSDHVSTTTTSEKKLYRFQKWTTPNNLNDWVTKRFEVTSDMLKDGGMTVKADWSTSLTKKTVNYWLQDTTGSAYIKSDVYSQVFYQPSKDNLSAKSIYGFSKRTSKPSGKQYPDSSENTYNFYYDRNISNIEYRYMDTKLGTKSVRFGADISGRDYNYIPERPDGVDSDYTFGGWYQDDPLCLGDPYAFGAMPDGGLLLYAKWSPPIKTITLNFMDGVTQDGTIKVPKYQVAEIPVPEREGYVFDGWYMNGNYTGEAFDVNAPVAENVTIYAKWEENLYASYKVRFVIADETADGGYRDIAEPVTGTDAVGTAVQVRAKVFAEGDYAAYAVNMPVITITIASAASDNEYMFIYSAPADLKYKVQYSYNGTVQYEENNGNFIQAEAARFVVSPTEEAAIALYENGYSIKERFIQAMLTSDNDTNIIKFTLDLVPYTITYEGLQDISGWEKKTGTVNPNPAMYTILTDSFHLVNPVRSGYMFTGWTTTAGTETGSAEHDPMHVHIEKGTRGNLVFTATWTPLRKIEVIAGSNSKIYDGTPLTDSTKEVRGELLEGDEVIATITGSATDVADSKLGNNRITAVTVKRDGTDVTRYYDINTKPGTLIISQRSVILTSASDRKEYDGTPLTNNTVTVGGDGFIAGEGADYIVTGSQTDQGWSYNTFIYELKEGTKKENYNISKTEGRLTVTAKTEQIIIKAASNSKMYDGTPLTDAGYTYTDNILLGGDVLFAEVEGSQTDAGISSNVVTSYKVMRGETDVTDNYTFGKCVSGILTVKKRNVTLTSGSDFKEYDGIPLTKDMVTVGGRGFAKGEGATYHVTGSQTDQGSSSNTFTYKLNEGTKAENYDISKIEGKLTVTAKTKLITITAASNGKTYDGTPLTDGRYSYTAGVLVEGDILTAVVEGSQTDAGTGRNTVTSYKVMRGMADVTDNYSFGKSQDGTLAVAKRKVIMTSASDRKEYDGTPLTNSTITVGGYGFVPGEGATYTVTGSRTEAGRAPNLFTYVLNEGTKETNYNIERVFGNLDVEAVSTQIIVKADSDSKPYDGTPLTNANYTYNEEILAEGDILTAVVEGSQTNAGSSANVVTSYQVMRGEKDVTGNYTFGDSVDGTLTVKKRSVVLTSADDEKVYDGTPLTNNTVTVGGDGFIAGEGADYIVTGSQTDQGWSYNTFTYNLNAGTDPKNYNITSQMGILRVSSVADEIVIKAASDSKLYDGIPLINATYTYSENILADGDILTAVVEGSQTNAGTGKNIVTSYQVMRGSADVTANYTFGDSIDGELTVTKRSVVLTSVDDEKEYDGTPLTNKTIIEGGDGFVQGEGAAYSVTGSQTNQGWSTNTFTYELNAGTEKGNYNIAKQEGKLIVTAKKDPIVITASSDKKVYDGSPLTNADYSYTDGILAEGDVLIAEVEGSQTDAGTGANVVTGYKVMRGDTDVTKNYTFGGSVDGILEVDRKPVEITVENSGKTYGEDDPVFKQAVIGAYIGTDLNGIDLTVVRNDTGNEDLGIHTNVLVTNRTEAEFNHLYPNYVFTVRAADFTIDLNTSSMAAAAIPVTEVYDGNTYGTKVSVLIDGMPTQGAVIRFRDADGGYTLEESPAYKDAGNYEVGYEVRKYGYAALRGEAAVTITKRPVIITAHKAQKYSGKDDPIFTADGGMGEAGNPDSGVVNGESLTYTVIRPDAGTEENMGEYPDAVRVIYDPDAGANRNYEIRTVPANFAIYLDALRINKTTVTQPANGSYYTVGETAGFNIKVENTGNTTLRNITVMDELEGAWLEALASGTDMKIAKLEAGNKIELKAYYQIQESDLGRNDLRNRAVAEADSTDPDSTGKIRAEDDSEILTVDNPNPGLDVKKFVTNNPPEGEGFAVGDEIRFTIAVSNNGNTTLKGVVVKDTLAGAEILPGSNYTVEQNNAVIDIMQPGTSIEVYARYVVKAEDIGKEDFKNTATAGSGETGGEGETPVIPTKGLAVEKSVTNQGTAENGLFTTGDTVTFDIKVINVGTETITGIRVDDRLEGAVVLESAGYNVKDNQAVIPALAPGANVVVKAEYQVEEADLRKENFTNVATATFKSEGGDKEVPGETPKIPTTDPARSWKITKTITNLPVRGYFRINEIAEFKIRVENTGQQVLNDIVIRDERKGAMLVGENGYTVNADGTIKIGTLAVGQAVEVNASYKVTASDVRERKFENIATATVGTEVETAKVEVRVGASGGNGGGGGGNGGGNGGGGPNPNTPSTNSGPGVANTIIDPAPVPLAPAPEDGLVLIDDGEVPLAPLPKTGEPVETLPWMLLFSSMALIVHTIWGRKKEKN